VYDWLWHGREDGPERIPKKGILVPQIIPEGPKTVHLIPTFTLILQLAARLREYYPQRVFYLYLDNLFLNIIII
jgi:hypothetical protein